MMQPVRTTVDLPPVAHLRASEIAAREGRSLSSVVAELTVRGLALREEPLRVSTDARSGFPVISLGHPVTAEDVAAALEE